MRKAALMLEGAERSLLVPACRDQPVNARTQPSGLGPSLAKAAPVLDMEGLGALLRYLAGDRDMAEPIREAAARASVLAGNHDGGAALRRSVNDLRHAILGALGAPRADWDMIDPATGGLDARARDVASGLILYLEDIRSPFNLGSIFRSAEAFGVERILLSPDCADPRHPRALRSAMGCLDVMPWERLESPPDLSGAFALETGGTPLETFSFPARGICVLGNEELGVRPETLVACGLGRASIGMHGAKASLNVAVAAGICLHAWRISLRGRSGACPSAPPAQ